MKGLCQFFTYMDLFTAKIEKFILENDLLREGQRIGIGISGGADSVALLRVLYGLKDRFKIDVSAVHVEHGIRGDDSEADMEFVRDLCRSMGVPLSVHRIDVPRLKKAWKVGMEEAARLARYDIFKKEIEDGLYAVAVAHNRNDHAETVLFNLARGTGLKGLSGIPVKRQGIIRPLLCVSRDEIEDYLQSLGQDFRTDKTNFDEAYSRNLIRHSLLPGMLSINSGALRHLADAAFDIGEADRYFEARAKDLYERAKLGDGSIDCNIVLAESELVQKYFWRTRIEKVAGRLKDITREHIDLLIKLSAAGTGKRVDLPHGISATNDYGVMRFSTPADCPKEKKGVSYGISEPFPIGILNGEVPLGSSLMEFLKEKTHTKYIDCGKITYGLEIRVPNKEDYIYLKGDLRKRIGRYYIDNKVPKDERFCMEAVIDGSGIVVLPDGRVSDRYMVSPDTSMVVRIDIDVYT